MSSNLEGSPSLASLEGATLTHPLSVLSEVDIEGMEFGPGELDSVGSSSDADDHYSLQNSGCSDSSYGHPCRRPGCPGLS